MEQQSIISPISREVLEEIKVAYFKKLGMENLIANKQGNPTDEDLVRLGDIINKYEELGMRVATAVVNEAQLKVSEITYWSVDFSNCQMTVTFKK